MKKTKSRFIHKQVAFVTKSGDYVTCDKGIVDILVELRRLGVETQYSCQGDARSAYVLGTGRSMRRLLIKLRLYSVLGWLSPKQRRTARKFFTGYRLWEFAIFRMQNPGSKSNFQIKVSRGEKGYSGKNSGYELERLYSQYYGNRTCLRWPPKDTEKVLKLLRSIR